MYNRQLALFPGLIPHVLLSCNQETGGVPGFEVEIKNEPADLGACCPQDTEMFQGTYQQMNDSF